MWGLGQGTHTPAFQEEMVSEKTEEEPEEKKGRKAFQQNNTEARKRELELKFKAWGRVALSLPFAPPTSQQAHFEAARRPLGLGVGRPDEEAALHASVQSPLQQILEPDGIHRRVLS